MRRKAKVDDNQPEIVAALRAIGCSVQSLAMVGQGCPDILVGYFHKNYLMEIKDGNKFKSQRKLTVDENIWIEHWKGQVAVVESVEQALAVVGARIT